jgi:DNA-binding transcriptional ArsR family regulator/protein-L-isoaspartate O-methyltransferase
LKTIDLLKTFSEPQRLRILNLLQNTELTVSELVEILGLSQSNVSHHLKILKDQNLIDFSKSGSQKFYKTVLKPDLPPNILKVWDEIKGSVKEPEETAEDERFLLKILKNRKSPDITQALNYWRKQQPDLMFTSDLALGGIKKSGFALDIGCGTGEFLKVIEHSFEWIVGIDNSIEQLAQAKKNTSANLNISLIQCDALMLPFNENTFDTVYYRLVLGFINNPASAISSAITTLKNGGRIAIIDQAGKSGNLDENFFYRLENEKNIKIIKYQRLNNLFICVMEKLFQLIDPES